MAILVGLIIAIILIVSGGLWYGIVYTDIICGPKFDLYPGVNIMYGGIPSGKAGDSGDNWKYVGKFDTFEEFKKKCESDSKCVAFVWNNNGGADGWDKMGYMSYDGSKGYTTVDYLTSISGVKIL